MSHPSAEECTTQNWAVLNKIVYPYSENELENWNC